MSIESYIKKQLDESWEKAEKVFKRKLEKPTLKYFDSKVMKKKNPPLGRATYGVNIIELNAVALKSNPTEMISDTIPHEAAHLIVNQVFGDVDQAHGKEFKQVMNYIFGIKKACSHCRVGAYPKAAEKINKPYVYKCKCRDHFISEKSHNRLEKGEIATCRRCSGKVIFKEML
jgi:SprT protein